MTTPNAAARRRLPSMTTFLLAILFAALALGVLVQANPGTRLPARDYGFYIYIGEQITQGKLPYRDAWESKPPAIFYLNAVALWIGRGSRWGVWIVELVSAATAIAISYVVMKRLWGTWPALAGVFSWVAGLNMTLQGGNLTEEYPLPLHFLAFFAFAKLWELADNRTANALLGAAFSISCLFRPNNAIPAAIAILLLLARSIAARRSLPAFARPLGWILAGALPPLLLTGVYFWYQGLWRDLIEASLLYNFSYSSTAITSASPIQVGFTVFGALAWLGLAGYLISLARLAVRDHQSPIYLLLAIGTPLTIFLSDPARRGYAHYLINWLPFLGMLGAAAASAAQAHLRGRIQEMPRANTIVLATVVAAVLVFLVVDGRAAEYQKAIGRVLQPPDSGIEVRSRSAIYAENHTEPGELVLFWAASPGENFMANRSSPSGSLFYPLYVSSPISARLNERFLQEVMAARPVLIIDVGDHEALAIDPQLRAEQIAAGFAWEHPPHNLDEFFGFVESNYYLDAMVGDRAVYRLRAE